MLFCTSCGGFLIPKKDKKGNHLVCRQCGTEFDTEGLELSISEKRKSAGEMINVRDSKDESLPVIKETCSKCGNDEAYWWSMQTRASDEPETRFFKCAKCSHTWREYD